MYKGSFESLSYKTLEFAVVYSLYSPTYEEMIRDDTLYNREVPIFAQRSAFFLLAIFCCRVVLPLSLAIQPENTNMEQRQNLFILKARLENESQLARLFPDESYTRERIAMIKKQILKAESRVGTVGACESAFLLPIECRR